MKSVSHTINIPRLENINPPGLGSRDQAASSHLVNKLYIKAFHRQTIQHRGNSIIATKECPFHSLDNPSKLRGEATSAKFVFLVDLIN